MAIPYIKQRKPFTQAIPKSHRQSFLPKSLQGSAALEGMDIPGAPPLARRIDEAVEQIELSASLRGERVACLEARRHLAWYLRGVPHSAYYKREIVQIETLGDLRKTAAGIRRDLG